MSARRHEEQLVRLDSMHREIVKIGRQKTAEFEHRRGQSELLLKNGRKLYRKLRGSRHESCHICLVDFENGENVSDI